MKNKIYILALVVGLVAIASTYILSGAFSPATHTTTISSTHQDILVQLSVEGKTYITRIADGSSVYDVMVQLSKASSLSFEATKYPEMGYFIESIGGKKNAHGSYWTLYVNGAYSHTGASNAKLSHDAVVEWKYQSL